MHFDKLTDAKRRPYMWAVIGLFTALLIVWVVWMSVALLSQARANAELSDRILDCTLPSGECYQRSEDRTAEAVSGINAGTLRVISAALSCQVDGVTEQNALADCTAQRAAQPAKEK